jgi:hypothetical protein
MRMLSEENWQKPNEENKWVVHRTSMLNRTNFFDVCTMFMSFNQVVTVFEQALQERSPSPLPPPPPNTYKDQENI